MNRMLKVWLSNVVCHIMLEETKDMKKTKSSDNGIFTQDARDVLFSKDYELLPNSHEAWDWEMAFLEKNALGKPDLIKRSAFFARIDGIPTNHYLMCNSVDTSIHDKKSIYTRSFFLANQYSTGYATHSLFPYRGNFHPHMVKGIFNIVGIEPGRLILDPMAGSCTACLEAKIMGINSIGIDLSPFCVLMGKSKSFATTMSFESLNKLEHLLPQILPILEATAELKINLQAVVSTDSLSPTEQAGVVDLILLAFLDSDGYARRRKRKIATDLFPEVFARYLATIRSFVEFVQSNKLTIEFGDTNIYTGSVLDLRIPSETVDCVLTSPPYSFAIDYVDNDAPQLQLMGVDIDSLKQRMVGLRGTNKEERIANYFKDMGVAFKEMGRVLKPSKYCIIIVGSNSIQTGGIKHEEEFKILADKAHLKLVKDMVKPIKGIQNTLHEEHVMFFRKK